MMTLKDLLDWVGYFLAVVGFGATLYKTIDVWVNHKTLTWSDVDKYSKKIIKRISKDKYIPDIIVGIGRGGAILGSILSGNILFPSNQKEKNIPVLDVERMYQWNNGERVELENGMVDFSCLKGKRVLLVSGDVLTGGTMKFYVHKIEEINALELKTGCLIKGVASTFQPDYYGKEISADFKMPWMYRGYGYSRDSRKPFKNRNIKTG